MDKVSEFPHQSLAKITIPATVPNGARKWHYGP